MTNSLYCPSQSPRRWWTFSLRSMLVLVLAVGVLLGLFMRQWNRAQQQRLAVEALAARGYKVRYDWQGGTLTWQRDPLIVDGAQSHVPDLLRKWLGDDFFHNVVSVNWGQWSNSDYQRDTSAPSLWTTLRHFPYLTHLEIVNETIYSHAELDPMVRQNLRALHLSNCRFESAETKGITDDLASLDRLYLLDTEAEAPILQRFLESERLTTLELYKPPPSALTGLHAGRNLKSLKIRGAYQPISADQIRAIGSCTGLRDLDLEGVLAQSGPPDALAPLGALQHLESLRLHLFHMTERQLQALHELPKLRDLDVQSKLIGGASLADIRAAGQLRSLTIRSSQVSNVFFERINEFAALESFALVRTNIDSAGLIAARWPPSLRSLVLPGRMNLDVLRSLRALTQLRNLRLGIWDEDVTSEQIKAEIDALKAALPDCKIEAYVAVPYSSAE